MCARIGLTVSFVQLLDFEDILAGSNGVEIEFIPPGESRKPRARNMSQGVKEQTSYGTSDRQQGGQKHRRQEDLKDSHGNFYATRMGRERRREGEEDVKEMLTMNVEAGRRGRRGDAFSLVALVSFGRDPAVVTSAIAASDRAPTAYQVHHNPQHAAEDAGHKSLTPSYRRLKNYGLSWIRDWFS